MLALQHVTWHTRPDARETNSVPAGVKNDKEYLDTSTPTSEHALLQINVFIYLQVIRYICCVVNAAI